MDRRKLGGKGLQEPPWDGSNPAASLPLVSSLRAGSFFPLKQNQDCIFSPLFFFCFFPLPYLYLPIFFLLDALTSGALVPERVLLQGLHGS